MNIYIKRALAFVPCILLFNMVCAMESKVQKVITTKDIFEALQSLNHQLDTAARVTKEQMVRAEAKLAVIEQTMEELKQGSKPRIAVPSYSTYCKPSAEVKDKKNDQQRFTFKNLAGKIPVSVTETTDFIKNPEKIYGSWDSCATRSIACGAAGDRKNIDGKGDCR